MKTLVNFDWQDLTDSTGFAAWRETKIRACGEASEAAPVAIDSLAEPGAEALAALHRRCAAANYALYSVARAEPTVDSDCAAMARLSAALGFARPEDHRSAGDWGVVALRTSDAAAQQGYIPYTTRPLNWHTDGYYNPAGRPVMAFILHCHSQADSGGENQIVDHELAYLRLREESPDLVAALMHPQAMTIPENREPDGTLRPASVGPVFFADPVSGRMQMRYTARTRSIAWRDDTATRRATDFLRDWLAGDDPLIRRLRLAPGQGIVNNNILHNRTGFADGEGPSGTRVILRVRFHQRLSETPIGTA